MPVLRGAVFRTAARAGASRHRHTAGAISPVAAVIKQGNMVSTQCSAPQIA